jgi:hypothetical protein
VIWLLTLTAALMLPLKVLGRYQNSSATRYTVSISIAVFVVLSTMYLAADYFTANGIDDSVMYHFGYGLAGAGFSEYSGLIGLSILLLLIAGLLAYYSFRRLGFPEGKLVRGHGPH